MKTAGEVGDDAGGDVSDVAVAAAADFVVLQVLIFLPFCVEEWEQEVFEEWHLLFEECYVCRH